MGGRLHFFWRRWEELGADYWVVCILREGYRLDFTEDPPLTRERILDSTPRDPLKFSAMQDLLKDLCAKDVVEDVTLENTPGFFGRFFMVPKKSGEYRGILDLSALNNYIRKERFKMDTAESIREQLRQGDWVISLDLKDAYYHIPVHRGYRLFYACVSKVESCSSRHW